MKKNLFLFCFVLALQPVSGQDYNKLDKEYQDIATQALAKLSPATKQWFETTIQKHPAGNFDSSWAKAQLNSKFTGAQMNEMAEMFVTMMAYLKMVQKEAREDRKIQRMSKEVALESKEKKLELDNKKIDQQKTEAAQKYDASMTAANTQLATGVVSGNAQVSSGINQNAKVTQVKTTPDNLKTQTNPADSSKQLIAEREKQLNKAQQTPEESKDQKSQSADRRRASLDNLQKMLDILRSMNTQL